ncbi:hypothetical protein [Sagittula sp. S175]|uniref:hypothetical protein n=1 Tax=Sagittula sp. S175 TaxID=3415129 RepID=UPI003C7BD38E
MSGQYRANDDLRRDGNTRLLHHDVWDQIAERSQAITPKPGGVGRAMKPPVPLQRGEVARTGIEAPA